MEKDIKVRESFRAKSIRISVYPGGEIIVTKPYFVSSLYIERFLKEKRAWIISARNKQRNSKVLTLKASRKDYLKNRNSAKKFVQKRVSYFSDIYKLNPNKIYIRNQKTRWGSCSSRGNLSFNWQLVKLPSYLADYIIVHEICHLKELNHSKKFWSLVSKTFPKYKETRKLVRKYAF